MPLPQGFTDLRQLRQDREALTNRQHEAAAEQAGETINLLTSVIQAPGYRIWKKALLASADGEHQKALAAKTPHEMALALGAESAYRAAAHAAEDLIAANQNAIGAMEQR